MSNQRYTIEHGNKAEPSAQLLYITSARSDKDWHSMEHSHYFAELFFITKGHGEFQIENEIISVTCNDLVLINPNVPHTELGSRKSPWEYIALGIEGLSFCLPDSLLPYDYNIHHLKPHHAQINTCLEQLLWEARTQAPASHTVCQKLSELLLLYITRYTRQNVMAAPQKKATRECRFIEQYIHEHYMEEITLQDLSSAAHINKYYLVHAFKDYKGISPINYLTQRRIEEAMHLLETTNYPVTKIAGMTGFSSQSYFSQAFKKITDMTPKQYRKQKESK